MILPEGKVGLHPGVIKFDILFWISINQQAKLKSGWLISTLELTIAILSSM